MSVGPLVRFPKENEEQAEERGDLVMQLMEEGERVGGLWCGPNSFVMFMSEEEMEDWSD